LKRYDQQITTALTALKKSKFRSRFKLTDKDHQYIQNKGMDTIRFHALDFITTRLAPAFPKNDGKQTQMRGRPVFIAQHATATCCRGCLWKWHRIVKGEGAYRRRNRVCGGTGDGVEVTRITPPDVIFFGWSQPKLILSQSTLVIDHFGTYLLFLRWERSMP
jgi:hypothetical protein